VCPAGVADRDCVEESSECRDLAERRGAPDSVGFDTGIACIDFRQVWRTGVGVYVFGFKPGLEFAANK